MGHSGVCPIMHRWTYAAINHIHVSLVCIRLTCHAIGIGPWKLGMLASCLYLWDIMWNLESPDHKEAWIIKVGGLVAPHMHIQLEGIHL